jgi:uncharacterized membrane protein YbaN (DUF454 family)
MLGLITLILGVIGIVLPILPTTPFLLLTLYFFAKSSHRFHQWFIHTKLYQKYLKDFVEQRTMTRRQKWTLMIIVDLMLVVTLIVINTFIVTLLIILLIVVKHYYFYRFVKIVY